MNHPVPHLSASSITDWIECPLRWHGRRVAKWPEPPSVAMVMGSAMHAAFEAHHRDDDPERALMTAWDTGNVAGLTPPLGALQRAFQALRAYRIHNPREQRDRSEVRFALNIRGVSVPIIGFIDLLRGDEIHEFKTGSARWWTQKRVDETLQGSVYWLAFQALFRSPPDAVIYHVIPTQPVVLPAMTLTTTRTAEQLRACTATVRRVWSEIQRGELIPKCQPERCLFPGQCRAWRGDQDVPTRSVDSGAGWPELVGAGG